MATRKIRVTMSGTQVDGQGPIVDIDFNGSNLDADIEVIALEGDSSLVKEYTVDVDSGTYDLGIDFKNDLGGDEDRNFVIESIEIAADGVNFNDFIVTEQNSNLAAWTNFEPMGWQKIPNPDFDDSMPKSDSNSPYLSNSSFDSTQPRSDDPDDLERQFGAHPGDNPKSHWEIVLEPIKIWTNGIATFNIDF